MSTQLLGLLIAGFGAAVALWTAFRGTRSEIAEEQRFDSPAFRLTSARPDEPDRLPVDAARLLTPPARVLPLFGPPAAQPELSLDELYRKHGDRHGIDWRLLKAIAIQESDENPNAVGPVGERGIMQILCRPDSEGVCTAPFNLPGWPDTESQLFDADHNIERGAQILRWNIDYTGGDIRRALAIYNGGLANPNFAYAASVIGRWDTVAAASGGGRVQLNV